MPIRQLAPDVAAKIAAGEVVERPASVVKELIENSIDAGATQIRVDLTNGGLQLIRVSDNGYGMTADELSLALARHATSKVAHIDDLEHIATLGFRGEALASIAAVAEVTLLSRHRGAVQGAQVSAANGRLTEAGAAASPEGTTLTVRNLFSAVPARLKFLKSRNTEVSHCHHMLEQYALAYPEIRFSVFSEGRQILATPGDGQLASAIIEVYGLQVAEQMIPISSLDGRDDDAQRPVVSGYTSLPACYKSTRQHISFFVNRRWVLSRMLTAAVEEAYHSLLLTGRHPVAVVNIALDPTQLDVNVHPAKTEIRFLKERRVYASVSRAVRNALLQGAEMPTWSKGQAPPARNAAGAASSPKLEPAAMPAEEEGGASIVEREVDDAISGVFDEEAEPAPFPGDNPWLTVSEEESGNKPPLLSRLWQSHVGLGAPTTQDARVPAEQATSARIAQHTVGAPLAGALDISGAALHIVPTALDISGAALDATSTTTGALPEAEASRTTWAADTPDRTAAPEQAMMPLMAGTLAVTPEEGRRLPHLRVVGQLAQSYIVTEGAEGMYLIDQHAAHERILLERMVAALQARAPFSQLLLTPLQLELAAQELEAIEEHLLELQRIGFALELLDACLLEVRAVPNVLLKQMNARSLHELLLDITGPGSSEYAGHSQTWEEHALANVACKAAIKANYFLTVSEMREMIEQLEQTNAPYSCCHGRPTMVHFSLSALEREFGRR